MRGRKNTNSFAEDNPIRVLRLAMGWSGTALGDKLGKPRSVIYRWERGQVLPNEANIKYIARMGGRDEDEFYAAYGAWFFPTRSRYRALEVAREREQQKAMLGAASG